MTKEEALALLTEKEHATSMPARDVAKIKEAVKIVAGSWAKPPE